MKVSRNFLIVGLALSWIGLQGCALIMNPKLLKTPIPVLKMMGGADEGNLDAIREALMSGVSVNARMVHNSVTALHIAAGRGHREIVQFLLENGADPNMKTTIQFDLEEGGTAAVGGTPLLYAAAKGHIEIVRLLLDHLADPNAATITSAVDPDGMVIPAGITPLHAVLGKEGQPPKLEIMRLLLEKGADPNTAFPQAFEFKGDIVPAGTSLLITAAFHQKQEVVKMLLAYGADPNAASSVGVTALLTAVGRGDLDTSRLLLSYGADPNIPVSKPFKTRGIQVYPGITPLISAVYHGQEELVSMLLSKGAVDTNDAALKLAKEKGDLKMVHLLRTTRQ